MLYFGSCIECVISEQVEKLKVTLHEIKYLTSAAQSTASLIENIMKSEKVKQLPNSAIRMLYTWLLQNKSAENGSTTSTTEPTDKVQVLPRTKDPPDSVTANTKRIRRLTLKLGEIERER